MNSKVGSEIILVPTGKSIIMGGTFFINILLTRYLGAEAFGIYSLCISLIMLVTGIIGVGLDVGALKFVPLYMEKDRHKSLLILKVVFKIKLLIGGLLFLISFPLANYISGSLLHGAASANIIKLTFFGILGMLLIGSSQVYLQVFQQFKKYLLLDFIHIIGKLVLIICLIFINLLTVKNSLVVYVTLPLVTFMLSLWIVPRDYLVASGPQKEIMREMIYFSKWLLLTLCLSTIYGKLDILMLSYLRGPEETGLYAAAFNLAFVPQMFATFMSIVLYPKIMPLCYKNKFTDFFHNYMKLMIPVYFLGVIVLLFAAKLLIPLLYTSSFAESIMIFQVLIPGTMLWLIVFPVPGPFISLNRPQFLVLIDIIIFIIIFFGNLIFIPKYGALGVAGVITCSKVVAGVIVLTWIFRNSRIIEKNLFHAPSTSLSSMP